MAAGAMALQHFVPQTFQEATPLYFLKTIVFKKMKRNRIHFDFVCQTTFSSPMQFVYQHTFSLTVRQAMSAEIHSFQFEK